MEIKYTFASKFYSLRAGLGILIFLIVLIFSTDISLSALLRRRRVNERKLPVKLWQFLFYWLIPFSFILTFFIVFTVFKETSTNQSFYIFAWINWLFVLIYVPKIIYTLYLGLLQILPRLKAGKHRVPVNKNHVKTRSISRSEFLGRMGIIAAGLPFLSIIYGMSKGRFNFHVKHIPISFKNLPEAFDGFRIVQISDLHLGNFNKEYHQLYPIVDLINNCQPDLLVFTGDLVNNFAEETDGWDALFSKLKAPMGKFSILGNHDYGNYSRWKTQNDKQQNFARILQAHDRFGFELLNNENRIIKRGSDAIGLCGVENWGKPPFPQTGDLPKALKGTKHLPFNILLSHDPDHWEAEVLNHPIDLTLSGHTHGMQMGITFKNFTWSPAQWKYKYWDGFYRKNDKTLYVNRGLGFVGIPMRVGMPPEITLLELKRA